MAKFKITAGATVDMITPDEMKEALRTAQQSWMTENALGIRFSDLRWTASVVGNAVDIGGAATEGDMLGPDAGMLWDVRRLRLNGLNTADTVTIYKNDNQASSTIADTGDVTKRLFLFSGQVILYPGDQLRIIGTGLNASTAQVSVSGQVLELPVGQAWRLVG